MRPEAKREMGAGGSAETFLHRRNSLEVSKSRGHVTQTVVMSLGGYRQRVGWADISASC